MTARARLDADRTAEPLTRIVHHPPRGGCLSPYMPLVNPEYVGDDGTRTPLGTPPAPEGSEEAVTMAIVETASRAHDVRVDALEKVADAARAVSMALEECDREAERLPVSSQSSAPLVRYIQSMKRLREAIHALDECQP